MGKEYDVGATASSPDVGDIRSRSDVERLEGRIEELKAQGDILEDTDIQDIHITRLYESEAQIKGDQIRELEDDLSGEQGEAFYEKAGDLDTETFGTLNHVDFPPGQLQTLFERAVNNDGFSNVNFDPENPTESLNTATEALRGGSEWQIGSQSNTLTEFGGGYAYVEVPDEQTQQELSHAIGAGHVMPIEGKIAGEHAVIVPGDELANLSPEQLGQMQAVSDTTAQSKAQQEQSPEAQAQSPKPDESKPEEMIM